MALRKLEKAEQAGGWVNLRAASTRQASAQKAPCSPGPGAVWVTVLKEGCDPRRARPAHCLVLHCSSVYRLKPAQGYCKSWLCA